MKCILYNNNERLVFFGFIKIMKIIFAAIFSSQNKEMLLSTESYTYMYILHKTIVMELLMIKAIEQCYAMSFSSLNHSTLNTPV